MSELLVRAKPHWMDSLTQTEVGKLDVGQKQSYEARSQIGDIIVVRPDGWLWGKEECLPNYVVVKLPDLKLEDAKKYEESLMEKVIEKDPQGKDIEVMRMLKHRKYQIPKTVIDNAKQLTQNSISVSKAQTITFISNIIQKVS